MDRPVNVTPDYERLVAAVAGDPAGFAELYDALAETECAASFLMLEYSYAGSQQVDPVRLAFEQAHTGGWLRKLLGALQQQKRLGSGTANALRFSGEAVLKPSASMSLVGATGDGLVDAGLRVCLVKVRVNGKPSCGTGFLIGPQMVLTNHHVIKPLLKAPAYTTSQPGSAEDLELVFDYLDHGRGTPVKVADEWLVASSTPHALESNGSLLSEVVDDIEGFRTCLDFAVIRLAHPVGRERGFYDLTRCMQPEEKMPLIVIQHPQSDPMRVTDGTAGAPWPASIGTRLPHDANTMAGSSGGLVVDEAYRPIGLHQGCHLKNGKPVANVAIPTHHIAAIALPLSAIQGLDPIWRIDSTQAPVFGRRRLQELLHAAVTGPVRVIKVLGPSRSGLSFSVDIMREYVVQWTDVAVRVSSDELAADVRELGIRWLSAAGAAPGLTSQLPIQQEADTAFPAWMRDMFVPKFMSMLEQILVGRRFWLVVDNLVNSGLSADDAGLLVLHLLERAPGHDRVRVVLLGGGDITAVPPAALGVETITPVTMKDIEETTAKHLVALTGKAAPQKASTLAAALHTICEENVAALAKHFPSVLRKIIHPGE